MFSLRRLFTLSRAGLSSRIATITSRRAPKLRLKQLPSIKRPLVRIHQDLFTIDEKIKRFADEWGPLTDLEKLVIVLEDRRFFSHRGFDWIAAIRETAKAITFQRAGGASTIDMQFVRTATGFRDLTAKRKIYEILLAWLIQFRYQKLVILRSYLACAFFGSHLYGCEKASRSLYGKHPTMLNEQEAAELAAMLVYPRPLRPSDEWTAQVKRRATYGLSWVGRLEKSFKQVPPRK